MKYYGYIYKIVCKINSKAYIGQTTRTIEDRWASHVFSSKKIKKNSMVISRAINKHGRENFTITCICKASNKEELDNREKVAIKLFKTIENGYNLKEGGNGSKHSEESKKKMSEQRKGKPKPESYKQKQRENNLGKKRPDWVIEKMRQSQLGEKGSFYGKKHTEEYKERMREANTGKKLSQQSKNKISIGNKGKKRSEEVKLKLKESNKGKKRFLGKKHSEESKLKISLKLKENSASRIKVLCLENNITYLSARHAAEALGIKKQHISDYFYGKTKTAKGFTFKKVI